MKVREAYRREYNRIKQAEYRSNPKPEPLIKYKIPTMEEIKLAVAKAGLPESEAEKFFNYYESNGWRVGKNPMKSWQAAMTGWKLRWEENQKNETRIGSPNQRPVIDRNAGTLNAGRSSDYANVGKLIQVPNPERSATGTDGPGSR